MHTAIHTIDVIIIVVYLAGLAGIGLHFSRRQTNLNEFFLARQSMAWLPVGLSLMAALDSAIDYLMQPSSTIRYGLILLVGTTSWFFLYPWVSMVTLPFYRRLNYFTAYEYLEARFDVRVRALAAVIFIVWRLGWMATAIYVPCLAISTASGDTIPVELLVVGLGAIVTLYTALGGIQAVIWNDVAQFCVRFGGLAAVVAIAGASVDGGLGQIWAIARDAGKTVVIAPVDLGAGSVVSRVQAFFFQPINVVSIMFGMVVGRMASYTSDQIMVQRLQTTRSVKDARRAFIVNAAGDALWMFALSFVGLALFAYFQTHALPGGFRDRQDPAVFHVAHVSSRHCRAGDRVDHGLVAVERRLGDQLVHVSGRHRHLPPLVQDTRRDNGRRRPGSPRCADLADRDGRVRRAGHRPGHERVADREPAGDREQAHQRVQRPAARHLRPGDVQPAGDEQRGAGGGNRRVVHRLLRGVPDPDWLHVAVHIRLRRDAGRRRRADARLSNQAERGRAANDVAQCDEERNTVASAYVATRAPSREAPVEPPSLVATRASELRCLRVRTFSF